MRKKRLDIEGFLLIFLALFYIIVGSEYNIWRMKKLIKGLKKEFKLEDLIEIFKQIAEALTEEEE